MLNISNGLAVALLSMKCYKITTYIIRRDKEANVPWQNPHNLYKCCVTCVIFKFVYSSRPVKIPSF